MRSKFIFIVALLCVLTSGFVFAQVYTGGTISLNLSIAETVPPENPKSNPSKILNASVNQQNDTIQGEFEQQLQRLRAFRETGSLEELLNEGNKIEKQWGKSGGESYGRLMLEFLGALTHSRYTNDRVQELSQDYATQSLKKADTFDLEIEWRLLSFLRYPHSEKDKIAIRQRAERVKLWLHIVYRLKREKDENFDPNDLPTLNVTPPRGNIRIAGMSPEAIKDPKLRAEYEAALKANAKKLEYYNKQYILRRDEEFIVKDAVKYISKMYSLPPKNLNELQGLLNNFNVSNNLKERIEAEIQLLTDNKR